MDNTTNYLGVDPCVLDSAAIEQYVSAHFTPDLNVIISFDTESSGDTMIELGMVVFIKGSFSLAQWTVWRKFSACCKGASFDPYEETNREFWCKFPSQFDRIVRHAKPVGEQIARVSTLIDAIKRVSTSTQFLARPAAYDHHVVAKTTEKLGVKNPFGFGGSSALICAGNAVNAFSRSVGVETPPSFETIMRRIGIEPKMHAAADDALAQARVYFAVFEKVFEVNDDVERILSNQPVSVEALGSKWKQLRALVAGETPEEKELDNRRAPPSKEMRFAFAGMLESMKHRVE